MLLAGLWVLGAFGAGCVHIAKTDAHLDLGKYVLFGVLGLLAFGVLLYGRHAGRREVRLGATRPQQAP